MRHTRFNVPGVVILIVVEVISFVTKICPGFIDVEHLLLQHCSCVIGTRSHFS